MHAFQNLNEYIEKEAYIFDVRRFVEAPPLINNISPIEQTQVLTYNNKILLDLADDCQYCVNELFTAIKSFADLLYGNSRAIHACSFKYKSIITINFAA